MLNEEKTRGITRSPGAQGSDVMMSHDLVMSLPGSPQMLPPILPFPCPNPLSSLPPLLPHSSLSLHALGCVIQHILIVLMPACTHSLPMHVTDTLLAAFHYASNINLLLGTDDFVLHSCQTVVLSMCAGISVSGFAKETQVKLPAINTFMGQPVKSTEEVKINSELFKLNL